MTMTIRYQTKNQSLTQVDSVKEIPETATIVLKMQHKQRMII